MSTISRPGGSAVDAQTITASYYNNDIDTIYNDYNGGITNANISASAAIAESKLAFNTSTGHSHNGSDSKAITTKNGFGWMVLGTLTVANTQSMQWPVPATMTITNVFAKTTSGTATVRLKKDSTDIKTSLSVTSTLTNTTSFDSTSLSSGQLLTMDITASSSGVDLFILLWVTTSA